jgi:hypothetical protein
MCQEPRSILFEDFGSDPMDILMSDILVFKNMRQTLFCVREPKGECQGRHLAKFYSIPYYSATFADV